MQFEQGSVIDDGRENCLQTLDGGHLMYAAGPHRTWDINADQALYFGEQPSLLVLIIDNL